MLLLVVWLIGAALATATGLMAVRLVANQVGDQAVPTLSSSDVAGALSAAASAPTPESTVTATPPSLPTTSAVPGAPSPPVTFTTAGGVVGAQCAAEVPALLYATPAPGYALHETELEGGVLSVRFEGEDARSRLDIGCRDGTAALLESTD